MKKSSKLNINHLSLSSENKHLSLSSENKHLSLSSENKHLPLSSGNKQLPLSSGRGLGRGFIINQNTMSTQTKTKHKQHSIGSKLPLSSENKHLSLSSENKQLPLYSGNKQNSLSSGNKHLPLSSGNKHLPLSSGRGLGRGLVLKAGFTLIEALVSMLIMSLFFMAASKVITQKQKTEFQKNPHGYYECYVGDEGLMAHRKDGNSTGDAYKVNKCFFSPPKKVSFVNIHYITNGSYFNYQEPIFNEDMDLASPGDFIGQLESVGIDTGNLELDEIKRAEKWEIDKRTFYTYLGLTHPDSKIYEKWCTNYDVVPTALFVAW